VELSTNENFLAKFKQQRDLKEVDLSLGLIKSIEDVPAS
jgi:hypothetical protein